MNDSPKIKGITATFMAGTAICYDVFQFLLNLIPVFGNLFSIGVGLFAWLTFYVWFKGLGVDFAKPKRAIGLWGAGISEMIPILNALPAWTGAVIYIIGTTKLEEKTGINLSTVGKIN